MEKKIKEVRLKNIEDVLKMVSDQPFDEDIKAHRGYYLYRGLPDKNYKLETSLQRNCKHLYKELEENILSNFTKYAELELISGSENIWKVMTLGQHHGLPTRLLDWTHSPFIALHFAVSEFTDEKFSEKDSAIWKIDAKELYELLPKDILSAAEKETKTTIFSLDMLYKAAN